MLMVGEHMQILDIGDRVLVVVKAGEHKCHSPEMFDKVRAHVTFDVDQVVVHLQTDATYFFYINKKTSQLLFDMKSLTHRLTLS